MSAGHTKSCALRLDGRECSCGWFGVPLPDRYARLAEENDRFRRALEEVVRGAGPFSRDRLEHATNTIEAMREIARAALAEPTP